MGDREKKVLGVLHRTCQTGIHISLSGGQQWVGRSGIIAFPSNQVSYPAIIHSAHLCLNVAGPSGQVTVLHLCTTRVKDGRTFHLAVARLVSSTGPHQVLGE